MYKKTDNEKQTMQMTVYEALAKKKLTQKKIARQMETLNTGELISMCKEGENTVGVKNTNKAEFQKNAQATMDSLMDNLKLIDAINAAVTKSNAVTTIEVNGTTMTVSDAIFRQYRIDAEINLYAKIVKRSNEVIVYVDKQNTENMTPEKIANHAAKVLGAMVTESTSSEEKKDIEKRAIDRYTADTELKVFDPLELHEWALAEYDNAVAFKDTINTKLNISNMQTMIEVVV